MKCTAVDDVPRSGYLTRGSLARRRGCARGGLSSRLTSGRWWRVCRAADFNLAGKGDQPRYHESDNDYARQHQSVAARAIFPQITRARPVIECRSRVMKRKKRLCRVNFWTIWIDERHCFLHQFPMN